MVAGEAQAQQGVDGCLRERIEYSTVNTFRLLAELSDESRVFECSGTIWGRSPLARRKNWLAVKGSMHGMQVQV